MTNVILDSGDLVEDGVFMDGEDTSDLSVTEEEDTTTMDFHYTI